MNGSRIAWPPPLTSRLLRLIPAPTSYSDVFTGKPSSRIAAFAVVPPMSSEIRLGMPVSRARKAQATTPAAGPDSTRCAGLRIAAAALIRPPLDCMICSGAEIPASASLDSSERM